MKSAVDTRIIFDNAGRITIQAGNWAHMYDSADDAAADVRLLLDGADPSTWDGHDEESVFDVGDDDIRNGRYRVRDLDDVRNIIAEGELQTSWINERQFFAALGVDTTY